MTSTYKRQKIAQYQEEIIIISLHLEPLIVKKTAKYEDISPNEFESEVYKLL